MTPPVEAERIAKGRETPAMLAQQERFKKECDRQHMLEPRDIYGRTDSERDAGLAVRSILLKEPKL